MAQLYTKVKLYLEDNSKTWEEEKNNIQLLQRNIYKDGITSGIQSINRWEVSGLAQPTEEQLNALESEATTLENDIKNKKVSDKESGKQKLKDLGLTDDEIKAIKGID